MRVLILDDDDERHQYFAEIYGGQEVVHVRKYSEALSALDSQRPFDVIQLDHDLGDFGPAEYGDGLREYTGLDVA